MDPSHDLWSIVGLCPARDHREGMARISIVLVRLPRLLRDIVVQAVAAASDMAIVCEYDTIEEAERLARSPVPLVFVAGAGGGASASALQELACRRPDTRVLGLSHDGRSGFVIELVPRQVPLGELSSSSLLGIIRSTARPPWAGSSADPDAS